MSVDGDSSDFESRVEQKLGNIEALLKALLLGIEIIASVQPGTLKQMSED